MKWGNRLPVMLFALMLPLSSVAATYASLNLTGTGDAKGQIGVDGVEYESALAVYPLSSSILEVTGVSASAPAYAGGHYFVTANMTLKQGGYNELKGLGQYIDFELSASSFGGIEDFVDPYLQCGDQRYVALEKTVSSNLIKLTYYIEDHLGQVSYDTDNLQTLLLNSGIENATKAVDFDCVFRFELNPGYRMPSLGNLTFGVRVYS